MIQKLTAFFVAISLELARATVRCLPSGKKSLIGFGMRADWKSSNLSLKLTCLWHREGGVWVFLREYPPETTVGI
jgi:hypothetical protein